ncbi:hypothetical protein HJC23_001307 [Cyclotella cryptica]|uniref:Uncharacterized protein n=1 Tax=Cyclotella cryptica TaxID=29204 RepID=A0ABD3P8Q7_9STRA
MKIITEWPTATASASLSSTGHTIALLSWANQRTQFRQPLTLIIDELHFIVNRDTIWRIDSLMTEGNIVIHRTRPPVWPKPPPNPGIIDAHEEKRIIEHSRFVSPRQFCNNHVQL